MNHWSVVKQFVKQYGLVRHQVESYDDFLLNTIPTILQDADPLTINVATLSGETKKSAYTFFNPLNIILPVSASVPDVRRHVFTFSNPLVTPASLVEYDGSIVPMTPQMARLRNLTYQVSVFIQVQHDTYKESDGTLLKSACERVLLCNIPLMLKSELCILKNKTEEELYALGECTNDDGGYFIVKGVERAIIAQEKIVNNMIYVFESKLTSAQRVKAEATMYSSAEGIHKSSSKITAKWMNISKSSKLNIPSFVIRVTSSNLKQDVPLAVLFKAMGVESREEIIRLCGIGEDLIRSTLEDGWVVSNQEQAIEWIAKKCNISGNTTAQRQQAVMDLLLKDMFPHIGGNQASKLPDKTWFLGLFVNRLMLTVQNKRESDDRDHFGNKRVDTTGSLISSLFKQSLIRMFSHFTESVIKKLGQNKTLNFHSEVNHTSITTDIAYSFKTGNWNVSKQKIPRPGVSQPLMRLTYIAMISHLRKFVTPMGKEGKIAKPRHLHISSWMRADPNETPEGEGCGLHKCLSLLAHVSLSTRTNVVQLIQRHLFHDLNVTKLPYSYQTAKLLIGGVWIANVEDGPLVTQLIRQLRRNGVLPFDMGITYRGLDNEIWVVTDAGRLCRPVYVVENNQLRITQEIIDLLPDKTYPVSWLIRNGYIEYIDAHEEEEMMIAMDPKDLTIYKDKYTHCEIHPQLILSLASGMVPFSDHTQSVRVTYSAQFFKQAMGMYTTNYQHRMDTSAHVLFYPQKPIVSTKTASLIHFDDMPAGQMAVVAVACYGGWNCEDSVIVNQSSIDRGMFRSVCYKTYEDEEKKMTGNITEDFGMPYENETHGYNKKEGYHAIDCHDGLPIPGSKVMGGDVIVGKTHSMPTLLDPQGLAAGLLTGLPMSEGKITKRDVSMMLKKTDKGVIDRVLVSNSDEVKHSIQDTFSNTRGFVRQRFAKVRVRSVRVPELGDKLAISAPQKGTIGLTVRQEDMFYTKDGVVPDVVLNPHSLPKRMTTNQVFETLFGKAAVTNGIPHVDGSAFSANTDTAMEMGQKLKEMGFDEYGTEVMYHGATGERMTAKIFIGLNFYQRLKHMPQDKMHSRSRGKLTALFRQPTEGRSRDGGLRTGEMETGVLSSHGVAHFLRERMFYLSDDFSTYYCKRCGFMATANFKTNYFRCGNCNFDKLDKIRLPYACKLLFQELMAMGIVPRIRMNPEAH